MPHYSHSRLFFQGGEGLAILSSFFLFDETRAYFARENCAIQKILNDSSSLIVIKSPPRLARITAGEFRMRIRSDLYNHHVR